ncbi:hypothetical protein ABT391_36810 [Streptomyces jumonjinensis]|uniref:hypothetical protein n=1 Tax=Streptomyces jumonjinensis TaxID=1945 RepID=UPI003317F186
MSGRERNIPQGTSALSAGSVQPVLTPALGRLRVGSAGEDRPEHGDDQEREPERSGRPRPGRTRGGRRPPPAAADAVPTTVRFDPEESSEVDRFVLELRDDARRRSLDKSEVIRELVRLAREHEPTRKALLRRLR